MPSSCSVSIFFINAFTELICVSFARIEFDLQRSDVLSLCYPRNHYYEGICYRFLSSSRRAPSERAVMLLRNTCILLLTILLNNACAQSIDEEEVQHFAEGSGGDTLSDDEDLEVSLELASFLMHLFILPHTYLHRISYRIHTCTKKRMVKNGFVCDKKRLKRYGSRMLLAKSSWIEILSEHIRVITVLHKTCYERVMLTEDKLQ